MPINPQHLALLKGNNNLQNRFTAMRSLTLTKPGFTEFLAASEKIGSKDLALTTETILLRAENGNDADALALTSWAVKAKPASRKAIIGTFLQKKRAPLFIHQASQLKRTEAAVVLKDYFSEGGTMTDIAEWLSVAGAVMKTGKIPTDTDMGWGSFFGGIVDAIVGAINTVADAIKNLGKNIAETVSAIVNWTQSKINDLMEAMIRAGKAIGDLLNEALKKSTALVQKILEGAYRAGKAVRDLVNWSLDKATTVIRTTLSKLEALMGSFTSLLQKIGEMVVSTYGKIVKAFFELGKTVFDFVSRLERLAYATAKAIVVEIARFGKRVTEIIGAMVNLARGVMRIVIDGLIAVGNSVLTLLREAVNWTVAKVTTFIGALKDLGRALVEILAAVATFVANVVVNMMKAVVAIWTRIVDVLEAIAQKAISIVKILLTALVGTIIHIKDVLAATLNDVRAAFRKGLIDGLLQIGKSALSLMKEAVLIAVSAAAVLFAILLEIFGTYRGLTPEERVEAEKVFGTSVKLDWVKLTTASLPNDLIMYLNGNRPFTTMYAINYKSGTTLKMKDLIHEIAHIWQAERSGGVYMIEALCSQVAGRGYELTAQDIANAAGKIENLQREQQAMVVQLYYEVEFQKSSMPASYANAGVTLELLTPLAKQVYKPFRLTPIGPIFNPAILVNPIRVIRNVPGR